MSVDLMTPEFRDDLNHASILLKEVRKHVINNMPMTASLASAQLRAHLLTLENRLFSAYSKDQPNHVAG
jgi:hypothetical protein